MPASTVTNTSGILTDILNGHYAAMSTDPNYSHPLLQRTVLSLDDIEYITEW
jgi:hypothetical protein